jgi:hypothetical protein
MTEEINFQHEFDIHVCTLLYNSVMSAILCYLKLFENRGLFHRSYTPYIPLLYKPLILHTRCTNPVHTLLNVSHGIPTICL